MLVFCEKPKYSARLTCEERSNAKGWREASIFGKLLVLETSFDVKRIREHNRLFICDAFAIVEFPRGLHEESRVSRVLAYTSVDLRICLCALRALFFTRDRDGLFEGSQESGRAKCIR